MRKIAIILLGLLGCLLFGADGGRAHAAVADPAAVTLSVDRASDDVWLCERTYNADLNLPRVLQEVAPASVVPLFQRGHSDAGAFFGRFAAARHDAGTPKATSEFQSSDLSAGLHPVDYYVYRLRRLII